MTAPMPSTANTMPCDVATVVANRCQECHGATLVGGAPMHLVTLADFQADLVVKTTQNMVGQTMKAHALAKLRIESQSTPMPPGNRLVDPDFTLLDGWLAAGAPAGTAEDDSPEPWMAPVTAAMESWATERGGVLVNAMPVGDADQLRHLLVTAEGTTLAASGLFAGTELVGSVAVTGRTVAAQDTTQDEAAAAGHPSSSINPFASGTWIHGKGEI